MKFLFSILLCLLLSFSLSEDCSRKAYHLHPIVQPVCDSQFTEFADLLFNYTVAPVPFSYSLHWKGIVSHGAHKAGTYLLTLDYSINSTSELVSRLDIEIDNSKYSSYFVSSDEPSNNADWDDMISFVQGLSEENNLIILFQPITRTMPFAHWHLSYYSQGQWNSDFCFLYFYAELHPKEKL